MLFKLAECRGTTYEDVQRRVMYKSSNTLTLLHALYVQARTRPSTLYMLYIVKAYRIVDRVQLQCMQWNYMTLVSRGDWPAALPHLPPKY